MYLHYVSQKGVKYLIFHHNWQMLPILRISSLEDFKSNVQCAIIMTPVHLQCTVILPCEKWKFKKCSQFIISLTSTKLLLCSSSSCSVSAVICKKKSIYLCPYMLAYWLVCRYMIRGFRRQTPGGVDLVSATLRWRRVKVQVSRRTKKMTCTVGLSFHQCTTSNWLLC